MGIRDLFRRPAEPQLTDEQIASLTATAREWIRPGFRERGTLAEELADYHDDIEASDDAVLAAAERIVDRVWRERLREEASWTTPSDFDRLEAAFAALAEQGVVGRMNFTCCQTCGSAEIDDERTLAEGVADGTYPYREWAYTFFHQQDAERLTDDTAILFLTYSAWRPAPEVDPDLRAAAKAGDQEARRELVRLTDVAVGQRVAAALRGVGLDVDWNEDSGSRIAVNIRDWRKPLPA